MIDALILDYGGVVRHEDPADYDDAGHLLGLASGRLWSLIRSLPEYLPSRIGQLSEEQFEEAVHAHLRDLAGPGAADAALARLRAYYRAQAPIRDIMRPLLGSLKGRVRLALLSNAARGSTIRFEQKGLLDYFDAIFCSGDLGMAKPDPDVFRVAARRLAVPIARCAFVDDVEENVAAARELGMHALVYHHSRHEELVEAIRRWRLLQENVNDADG